MNEYQSEEKTFRDNLFERLDKQDNVLERIEAQTLKTNGRVTVLETRLETYDELKRTVYSLKDWKKYVLGFSAGVILLGGLAYTLTISEIKASAKEAGKDAAQELINTQKDDIIKKTISAINQSYNLNVIDPN